MGGIPFAALEFAANGRGNSAVALRKVYLLLRLD